MIQADPTHLSVSVIIATYNHARFVAGAINSLLNQTRPPEEIIVVDDGSTDDTQAVLARYGTPVRVLRQTNQGRSVARNAGLSVARGDAIVFLDSDDELVPDSLERRVKILEASPTVDVVYGDMYIVDTDGRRLGVHREYMPGPRPSGFVLGELALRCFILMPAMIRRTAIGQHRFDEQLVRGEDYDLWRRLAAAGQFRYVEEPIGNYRIHDANTVTAEPDKMLESELEIQRRVFAMPQFAALSRAEQAKAYRYHGVKSAILDRSIAARHYLGQSVVAAPFSPTNYALSLLNLLSPAALRWLVLARRRRNRKTLRAVATEPSSNATSKSTTPMDREFHSAGRRPDPSPAVSQPCEVPR